MSTENEQMEVETIVIPAEDGSDPECAILSDFRYNGKSYYLLAVILEDDTLSDETLLYGYEEFDDGIELRNLDEEEFAKVSAYYEKNIAE